MKIPSTIQVMGHTYEISLEKDSSQLTGNMGASNAARCKIVLDSSFPPSKLEETFLHEVMHAVFANMGMDNVEGVKQNEEYIVNTLANGLYQVLKENKLRFL